MLFIFNTYRAVQKNWNYADPIDYRGVYIGAKLFSENLPLYNDSFGAKLWQELKTEEQFTSSTDFGNEYVSISLYPPQTFTTFYSLSLFPWKIARILWWGVCIFSLFILTYLCFKWSGNYWIIALILAFSGSFFALSLGQPVLPVLACIALAVHFKDKPILAGILLGIAFLKFAVVIPFALWFFVQKKYKLLFVSGLTAIILLLPLVIQNPNVITDWATKTSWYYDFIYTPHPNNTYTFSNSELTILLDYYLGLDVRVWKGINIVGQLVGYLFCVILFLKKRLSLDYLLLGLLLVSFVFSYHLSYDPLVFLIPIAFLPFRNTGLIAFGAFVILSLPLNRIAGEVTLLKFNYPILCLIALLVFIFAAFKNKLGTSTKISTH